MNRDYRHWSRIASEWVASAQTPRHDAYWAYRNSLLAVIGNGYGHALDIGCCEGRISRVLKDSGYRVTATDPVETFVSVSKQAGSADDYGVAAAANLPFAEGTFDLAIAYNVLMDIDDVAMALREIARVPRPTGTLVISIVHPFADRGRFAGPEPDAPFVLHGSYFGQDRFETIEERNGLQMHFAGWSRPLQSYMLELERAGFVVSSLREPIQMPVQHGPMGNRGAVFHCFFAESSAFVFLDQPSNRGAHFVGEKSYGSQPLARIDARVGAAGF